MSVFDLFLKLIERREGSRRAVFTDYLLPIHQGVQELHISYLHDLNDLLQRIDTAPRGDELARTVAHLFEVKIRERSEIFEGLSAARNVARKRLDVELTPLEAYLDSVEGYLMPEAVSLEEAHEMLTDGIYVPEERLLAAVTEFRRRGGDLGGPHLGFFLRDVAAGLLLGDTPAPTAEQVGDASELLLKLEQEGLVTHANPTYARIRIALADADVTPVIISALIRRMLVQLQDSYRHVLRGFTGAKNTLVG